MSLTEVDSSNAHKYAYERIKLEYIKLLYHKYPHIISWLEYEVKRADPKHDYYYPEKFAHRAIVVNTHINQKLCEEKLSCNPFTGNNDNNGACKMHEEASNYRIGDQDDFDVHCQPSCYNLKKRLNPDDTTIQSFPLKYHNNECAFVSSGLLAWMEFPYFRSKTIYEHRINDLPTGFNRSKNPHPETAAGIKYEYNKLYCDSFFDAFDEKNKNCYTKWYDVIGNAIVGEYIIKLCKSAHQASINNGSDLPSMSNFTPPPPIAEKYLLKNWLRDINPKFKVPNPGVDAPNVVNNKSGTSAVQNSAVALNSVDLKKNVTPKLSVEERRRLETQPINIRKRKRRAEDSVISTNNENEFMTFMMHFTNVFMKPEFWRDLGIVMSAQMLAKWLKNLSVYMVKELMPKLFMSTLKSSVMDKIFADVMKGTVRQMAVALVTKISADFAVRLVAILNPVGAIIEVVFILTQIMDMLLSVIDPANFNKKYPEGYLDAVVLSTEFNLRKQLQLHKPVLKFEFLVPLLLSQDEIGRISLKSYEYIGEYVKALRVNSEGAVINKGEEKDIHEVIKRYNTENKKKMEKIQLYTEKELDLYEADHMRRMKLIDRIKQTFYCFGAGLIMAVTLNFMILTYALIVIICLLIYCQYAAVGHTDITDIESFFRWF